MDHEREARGVRRWGTVGAVVGGLLGLVLGVGGLLGGEGAALLWSAPAFACMAAGVSIAARVRGAYTYSEIADMPRRERRRHVVRHLGPALALVGAGVGFFVLTGTSEL